MKNRRGTMRYPLIRSKKPGSLVIDNYIIEELLFREDFPEYLTEEERTYEAIVAAAKIQREMAMKEMEESN